MDIFISNFAVSEDGIVYEQREPNYKENKIVLSIKVYIAICTYTVYTKLMQSYFRL